MKTRTLALIVFATGSLLAGAWIAGAATALPVIPAGTRVDVQLTTTVSSSANQDGDPFTAEIENPVFANGQEVIPAGSTLRGHVTFVKPPGRVRGKAEMRLVADRIYLKGGQQYTFTAQLGKDNTQNGVKVGPEGTVEGASKSKKKALRDEGIGTAAGAGLGAISMGGTGALYGAGIGAAVAAIHALAMHHKNVVLDAGTELDFVLSTPGTQAKAPKTSGASAPFICTSCRD